MTNYRLTFFKGTDEEHITISLGKNDLYWDLEDFGYMNPLIEVLI